MHNTCMKSVKTFKIIITRLQELHVCSSLKSINDYSMNIIEFFFVSVKNIDGFVFNANDQNYVVLIVDRSNDN